MTIPFRIYNTVQQEIIPVPQLFTIDTARWHINTDYHNLSKNALSKGL
jgi:hypothetical protein